MTGFLGSKFVPSVLSETLFHIGDVPISAVTGITVVVILLGAMLISSLAQRAVRRAFQYRGADTEGTALATSRLVHYGILLTGFGVALQTVGIDLGTLFAAGAIFAVGLGFAMQSIAQNFVSGVILLIERSIKPGDIIEVSEGMVRVSRMGIRATIVEMRDGENLIVPNSALIQSTVKNFTFDSNHIRVRVAVGVTYGSDMKLVFDILNEVARNMAQRWGDADRETQVVMTEFGDNSVNFHVAVWMHEPWRHRFAVSELHEAIWFAFKEKGVTIAFPQLDVHLDAPVVEALARLGKTSNH